ncbi:hypothetical protein BKA70DRAFT_410188 [Coprinopsis sp. MPI-PUGE-AT-0042]|nr:hypothetical protein BKA70DRAFT_410188 [Coprinopsis sp. MPI-PUGE-AT-0042]
MRSTVAHGLVTAAFISASFATIFDVSVGFDGLPSFEPPSIHAEPGDEVNFILYVDHLSLTQTEVNSPCQPKNSDTIPSVSFPASGSTKRTLRLVLGADYDGSPLRFLLGERAFCSPENLFTVKPPLAELPARGEGTSSGTRVDSPEQTSSHPPPHISIKPTQITTPGPIIETVPSDTTDLVIPSTHPPPIPVFVSQTATPDHEEAVSDTVASPPIATPNEPGTTSTLIVAVLPHTTLVTERVFPRPSSESISAGTSIRLQPSRSSAVSDPVNASDSDSDSDSSARRLMVVSPLLLLALFLCTT